MNAKYKPYLKYFVIFLLLLGIYFYTTTQKSNDTLYYYVKISGAVQKPGTYKLMTSENITKALQQAKLKNNANIAQIDFNKKNIKSFYVPYQKNDRTYTSNNSKGGNINIYLTEKNYPQAEKSNTTPQLKYNYVNVPNTSQSSRYISNPISKNTSITPVVKPSTSPDSYKKLLASVTYMSNGNVNNQTNQVANIGNDKLIELLQKNLKDELYIKFLKNAISEGSTNQNKPTSNDGTKINIYLQSENPNKSQTNLNNQQNQTNNKPQTTSYQNNNQVKPLANNQQNQTAKPLVNNVQNQQLNPTNQSFGNNYKPQPTTYQNNYNQNPQAKPPVNNIQKPQPTNDTTKKDPLAELYGNKNAYFCSKYENKIKENNKHPKNSVDYVNLNDFKGDSESENKAIQKFYMKFLFLYARYTPYTKPKVYDRISKYVFQQRNHRIDHFCDIYLSNLLDSEIDYDILTNFAQIL